MTNTEITATALRETQDALYTKWNKLGLLNELDGKGYKQFTAVLLENQRLRNEEIEEEPCYKRCAIPIARRIAGGLFARHVAYVQALLSRDGNIFHPDGSLQQIEANEFPLRSKWTSIPTSGGRIHCLDAEAQLCEIIAQEITMQIDRQLMTSIDNAAAIRNKVDFNELGKPKEGQPFNIGQSLGRAWIGVADAIGKLADEVDENCGHHPTWMVTSPELAHIVEDNRQEQMWNFGFQRYGKLRGMEVWTDPLMPVGKVVLGYRGEDPQDAGCVFCPYLLLNLVSPSNNISTIYGFRVTKPECFGSLRIANVV